MQITKEALEKRLEGLTQKQSQLAADLNAVIGMCSECRATIALLDAPEPEAPKAEELGPHKQ
jgi:predicted anti-sigma-YlaC factor YlaD